MFESNKVLVIGAGTMGVQISQVLALNGFQVVLKSRSENSLRFGLEKINEDFRKNVEKNRTTTHEAQKALKKIVGTTSFLEMDGPVGLVIETIVEDIDKKKAMFKEISEILPTNVIFCSNTSSFSISELADSVASPDRFIGLHFFNPATVMKLVEVVRGSKTSQQTCFAIDVFARSLGKTPIILDDSPGFLVNRMLIPAINEAIFILEAGIASKEDIDLSIKLGAKHPLGPLELADLIGLDVCLSIMESLFKQFHDSKYLPCPLLVKMVQMNHLGRKTKIGFYKY